MKNTTYIVITSIFEPTQAVLDYAAMKNVKLIVVGDLKTPDGWNVEGIDFISHQIQKEMPYGICRELPFNHYCRKMIGYLKAANDGAEVIIDTDDDNIPLNNWGFPKNFGEYDVLCGDEIFINIYKYFTEKFVWPRGMPLKSIRSTKSNHNFQNKYSKVGIWQGLANDDPDVDAIYRLIDDSPVVFNNRNPIVLDEGVVSPFNSQNTYIVKELFPLLYLPTTVTFRFTDILRGLIAQPIMWNQGFKLGFTEATVTQLRNPHDYLKDFESEVPMYLYTEKCLEITKGCITAGQSIEDSILKVYNELKKAEIVKESEIKILELWLNDLQKIK
ncbi:STELLO glycosyltransferase family protein [Polynucleobacter sp. AP-Reno-20A-A9]|uniref:STELLO glycosyltransferase family protein n=1 Tax=Polynucleobacter sp. AP-Reno-20A-A9 TaxID=2576925 RepID=UPI001C0DF5C7|nr:STELLO glycosyltransferase family protein [Polynucleobacter sp. AP-Reno-20A-A9]MBU3629318.1 DUF288 domain-containing protein [Polynucleobacter sp. AP-Reno-20A-A9]